MSEDVATLIGDLVGSRRSRDRAALHTGLEARLADVNATFAPLTPLRITVGDEYQGVFATVAEAAHAALHLRVAMLPDQDVRHGLGWGPVAVLQEEPRVEDGAGWWSARDALVAVEEVADRPATRWRRTAYLPAPEATGGPDPAWVEATLALLDQVVGGLSSRAVSVLHGLLQGRTQKEVAADLGITASAVSQRVRADGLGAVLLARDLLAGRAERGRTP